MAGVTTWDGGATTWDAGLTLWDGATADSSGGGYPSKKRLDWFWPGSKDDPIHEQIEREINNALATKTEAPAASKQPDAKPVESDADYWMQVSALLAQFNTHINAVTPVLPEILAAQSRIEQKKALFVLNRALQALQIIFMMEQDER